MVRLIGTTLAIALVSTLQIKTARALPKNEFRTWDVYRISKQEPLDTASLMGKTIRFPGEKVLAKKTVNDKTFGLTLLVVTDKAVQFVTQNNNGLEIKLTYGYILEGARSATISEDGKWIMVKGLYGTRLISNGKMIISRFVPSTSPNADETQSNK